MKRKVLAICLSALMVVSLAACGSKSSTQTTATSGTEAAREKKEEKIEQINFKVSHPRPEGSDNDLLTKKFLKEVQDALGEERFSYEIYPNNELGDYTVVQESMSMGEIDMCMQSISTNVDQSLTLATAPYLVENWEQAQKLYNTSDGIVSIYIEEALEKQNIKLLAMIPKYFNAIATVEEPNDIYNLFGDKKIKMRVPTMKSYELVAQTLGYQTTPMNWSDVFTSMQTGIIDGCFGGGPEGFYTSIKEVMKYLILYRNAFEPHWLMMNLDDWNAFTPEEQSKVSEIAKKLEAQAFADAEVRDAKYIQMFKDEGINVIEFTDEQIEEISTKVRSEVWPQLEDIFGKEIFDKIKTELGIN
ncbi:MAG: TRAP transporter substrate-binding protein DctP [Sedimentibacter sp.]